MKLKDKVVIIYDQNISRLSKLYGKIEDADELSKIVNNHLSVAIDEIEEDEMTCALKGLNVMKFSSVLAHGTAIFTQEALADVTPINWSNDVMDGQYKDETIIKTKMEENDMTKELSIESIKKELMDALVGDMRIITSFADKEKKKATDYIGTNIFNHLDGGDLGTITTDTYIHFDVMKSKESMHMIKTNDCKYDVIIELRAHRDIANEGDMYVNCVDILSKYIEEIINELYPYHRQYSNIVSRCGKYYITRDIRFTLREEDLIDYGKFLESKASA